MIDDVRMIDGADGTATLLVVTDDRDLRHGARLRGARTAGSAWLLGRLDSGRLRVAVDRQPATGAAARPPASGPAPSTSPALSSDGDPAEMDRPSWKRRTRRDDQEGQPQEGSQGGRDW